MSSSDPRAVALVHARGLGGLALLAHYAGDYATAARHHAQVVDILSATVGGSHPATLSAMTSRGASAYAAGDRDGARMHWMQALDRAQDVYDPHAPEIGTLDIPVAILNASLRSRTPAIFTSALWVGHGGLASYGPDYYAQGLQAAGLVARVLRGAKPADVPVEGADRIELAVNLKTADLLGITVPRKVMLRAETFRR